MSTGYKNIKDFTLVQDCQTIFDLACRGRMSHELANTLVLELLYADTSTRKSGDDLHREVRYYAEA